MAPKQTTSKVGCGGDQIDPQSLMDVEREGKRTRDAAANPLIECTAKEGRDKDRVRPKIGQPVEGVVGATSASHAAASTSSPPSISQPPQQQHQICLQHQPLDPLGPRLKDPQLSEGWSGRHAATPSPPQFMPQQQQQPSGPMDILRSIESSTVHAGHLLGSPLIIAAGRIVGGLHQALAGRAEDRSLDSFRVLVSTCMGQAQASLLPSPFPQPSSSPLPLSLTVPAQIQLSMQPPQPEASQIAAARQVGLPQQQQGFSSLNRAPVSAQPPPPPRDLPTQGGGGKAHSQLPRGGKASQQPFFFFFFSTRT